jgi:ATP-dependent DNA helicase RecG
MVSKFIGAALERLPALPEWQEPNWVRQQGFPTFDAALRALHRPGNAAEISEEALMKSAYRRRLAFDELLASQLTLALVRSRMRRQPGRVNAGDGALVERLKGALPYTLTASQERAVADIRADLVADKRMLRLLQGDVGSGKTVVALLAMASAIEAAGKRPSWRRPRSWPVSTSSGSSPWCARSA